MNTFKFTRRELYDYIWKKPLTSLISTYNISYSELKQLLHKYEIPVPPNGYWSKLKAGQKITPTPLSSNFKVEDIIEYTPKEKKLPKKEVASALPTDRTTPLVINNPDKLIVAARKIYEKEFKKTSFDELQYLGWATINIKVSSKMINRAFNFMDAFIKILRKNNGDILVESHNTWAIFDDEKFSIQLREKQNRILKENNTPYSWEQYDYKPSGILIFKVGEHYWNTKEWKDGRDRIEDQLMNILEHLRYSSIEEKERKRKQAELRIEESNKRQIQLEFERLRSQELEKFKQLNTAFELWQKAQNMRLYLEELRKKMIEHEQYNEDFKNWLKWANDKIDWFDPMINKEEDLLKDVDKATLTIAKKNHLF